MSNLKIKIKNFRNSLKKNGIKTEIRRLKNYLKYKKTVIDPYKEWMELNEPNNEALNIQRRYNSFLNCSFSFVLQDDTPVSSIKNQTYTNWKIINKVEIANDESDYIVLVGSNIELAEFALYDIVKTAESKDGMAFYSDNDYMVDGERSNPCFKPDFAIDTLLSRAYIGNFLVIKNKFLKAHPELLEDLNDEVFFDLQLRISEYTKDFVHIPRILYHYTSVVNVNTTAQKEIIRKYLLRNRIAFKEVKDGLYNGDYKIDYVIKGNPKISIVVPNKDHIDDLQKLINSMNDSTYKNYELVIVENNSDRPETFEYYEKIQKEDSRIRVEKFEINYFNYSSIVNYGVKKSTGDYILMLNNDIEILTPDWIEQMLMYAQRDDVGICGIKLFFPDDTIQHAGVTMGIRGLAGHRYREVSKNDFQKDDYINIVQDLSAVTAACFLVRKDLYNEVLGFDEKLAVAFNDVDFCLKVRKKGLLIVYNPFAYGYHYESKSRGEDTENKEKQARFAREYGLFVTRWSEVLGKGDPYYNVNYRLDVDIPQINYNKI